MTDFASDILRGAAAIAEELFDSRHRSTAAKFTICICGDSFRLGSRGIRSSRRGPRFGSITPLSKKAMTSAATATNTVKSSRPKPRHMRAVPP